MYAEASAPPLWICCIRSSQVEADVISPLCVAMIRRLGVDRLASTMAAHITAVLGATG
jgi:hypothetical protein